MSLLSGPEKHAFFLSYGLVEPQTEIIYMYILLCILGRSAQSDQST